MNKRNFCKKILSGLSCIVPLSLFKTNDSHALLDNIPSEKDFLENVVNRSLRIGTAHTSGNVMDKIIQVVSENLHFKKYAESFIENHPDGYAAFKMIEECGSDPNWAKKIVEKSSTCSGVFNMLENGYYNKSWAEKMIEEKESGWCAARMVREYGSSLNWAKKIVEIHKNERAAHELVSEGLSVEWYENLTGDSYYLESKTI